MALTTRERFTHLRALAKQALSAWLPAKPGSIAPAVEQAEPLDLCTALYFQAEPRANGVPQAVGDAFSSAALPSGSPLFHGRDNELDTLAEALTHWRAGKKTMLAVTGQSGSGLSSFLSQVDGLAASGETVRHLRLGVRPQHGEDALAMAAAMLDIADPPTGFDALKETVLALEPRILVLDGGHALASRIMGSVQAIRSLGALMVATAGRHFWVLGCHEQAWRRLIYLHQADRYFSRRIELGYLSLDALTATVAARLAHCGFHLADTSASGAENTPPAGLMETLYRLSKGKPDLAFFHLLRAAEFEPDNPEFRLGAWHPLDYSPLRQLDRDELFTLAELAAHGSLTEWEHQHIFRARPEDTRLLFAHLSRLGLVECAPDNAGHYRLVPLFSDAVIAHLVNGNYLY